MAKSIPTVTPTAAPSLGIAQSTLEGVFTVTPPRPFEDARGPLAAVYKRLPYQELGINQEFIQDKVSVSSIYVLRGLRGDAQSWKLVSCLYGRSYLVVVNWDQDSDQRGVWESFIISDQNRAQVLIPPKFAVGTLALSDQAVTLEKRSAVQSREDEFGISWNDPSLDIWWPVASPAMSQEDQILSKD